MRISSRKTFFLKFILPPLVLLWGGMWLVIALEEPTSEMFFSGVVPLVICIVVSALTYLTMSKFADEVLDRNDHLLVTRSGVQERIELSNIINVNFSTTVANISLVTLRLAKPSKFGLDIVFLPVARFGLSVGNRNEIAEDLIERAHQARQPGLRI